MKILIISCTMPPDGSATAGLLDNLCRCFKEMGHQVDGITTKNSIYNSNVTTFSGGNIFHANYVYWYPPGKKRFKDLLFAVYKRVVVRLAPEDKLIYNKMRVKALVREMRKRKAKSYDAIIAACAQYDAMEAVYLYSKKSDFNGRIVLYQVDPLSDNLAYQSDGVDFLMGLEKKYYSICDCIITTPIIDSAKQNIWPISNVIVSEFPAIIPTTPHIKPHNDHIICLFAGYLHNIIRNPRYTLELFSSISDPQIHFYIVGNGYEEMLREYDRGKLRGRLHLIGKLNNEECITWLKKADVLVNIGNSVSNMTPSKIFTYINYCKPILNIYKKDDCPTLDYLSDYPVKMNIKETDSIEKRTADSVANWINLNTKQEIDPKTVFSHFEKMTPQYVAQQIIDGICSEKG